MATSLSAYELNVKQYKKLNDWTYTLPMFILHGDGSIISYLWIGWQLSYTGFHSEPDQVTGLLHPLAGNTATFSFRKHHTNIIVKV